MRIIKSAPNESGAYPAIRTWAWDAIPDGWLHVSDDCNDGAMQTHAGFVTLTVVNNVVAAITGDDAAYHAWKDSLPEPAPTDPDPDADRDALLVDHEYRLTLLELGVM